MATVDPKLYRELRSKFPEVPDSIVTSYMTKLGNDRIKCMEVLSQESPKHLYGQQSVNDPIGESGEPRPRSDSSSSNMSNASSGSVSSRPPYHTSRSFSNVPGNRNPITFPDDGSPTSAPVRPSDLNQFIPYYHGNGNVNIPHINCNNNTVRPGYEGMMSNYGAGSMGHLPSGNSPTQPVKPGVLRPIEVKHIKSNMDQAENPSQSPQTYTYKIRIDRGQGSAGHSGGNVGPPLTPERGGGGWSYHPVSQNKPYPSHFQGNPQTQNSAFSSDLHPLPISHFENINLTPGVVYRSPTEEYDQGFGASNYNHSSQTKIYLNPVVSPNPQTSVKSPIMDRTMNSTLTGQFQNSAGLDPRMSPNYLNMRINHASEHPRDLSNSQGLGRPLVVEITRREGGGGGGAVQNHIQYFNEIASGSNTPGGHSVVTHGSVIGPNGQLCDGLLGSEQTVINLEGVSPSHEEGGFLKCPPMPNMCMVPGHPPGPMAHGGGCCSDSDNVFRGDFRQNSRPFLSPTSSQSSVSSESSSAISNNRPPLGHLLHDDAEEYTQVLLSHQNSRMQKLSEDLSAAEDRLQQLKHEVNHLQTSSIDRQRKRTSPFPSAVDLTKLRGENVQLQADIQLMTREIDMYNNGQTPLGVLDPLEEQNFYSFTNTGQRGSIYASSGEPHPTNKVFTSTVTTSVTPSLPPQPQPPQPQPPQRPRPENPDSVPPILPPRDKTKVEPPPPLPPRVGIVGQVPPPPPHQPTVGSGDSDADAPQWSCSACTFLNHPALNKCECCEMPRMNFSSSTLSSPRDVIDTYPNQLQSTPST